AEVGHPTVAADVHLRPGEVERAGDRSGPAGPRDVAGDGGGAVLEEGQALVDATGGPTQDHAPVAADADAVGVAVARGVGDHHPLAQQAALAAEAEAAAVHVVDAR